MRVLSVIAALAMCTAPLQAQGYNHNPRHGFWIGFGLGPGSIGADCGSCGTDRSDGVAGYIRAGGTLSQHFLLGVEASGWSMSVNGVNQSMGVGTLVLFWYPSRHGGFYFDGGIGGLTYRRDNGFSVTTDR